MILIGRLKGVRTCRIERVCVANLEGGRHLREAIPNATLRPSLARHSFAASPVVPTVVVAAALSFGVTLTSSSSSSRPPIFRFRGPPSQGSSGATTLWSAAASRTAARPACRHTRPCT
jgi:hypothetical protein